MPLIRISVSSIFYQKVKQNTEDFVELDDHLSRLNDVLNPFAGIEQSDMPWALRERITRLAVYVIRYLLHPISYSLIWDQRTAEGFQGDRECCGS
jgi:hypothetical protein